MFSEFFKLELRSAFKSPMVYVFLFIVALLSFGAVASDAVTIGGAVGNVNKNAPHTLTNFTLILGIFGLLFAAAFFNNAALRDYNNQFQEILFSTPLKKSGFFFGRFLGALILSTIPLFGVFIGAWIGSIIGPLAGWTDASQMGPFFLETIVNNYFIFILPNMFFAGSIIFLLAHKFKSTIVSFVGAMAIVVAYLSSATLLSDLDNENLAALTDIFGIGTYSVYSRYFTPIERNTLSPQFEGLILQNRAIWLTAGLIISIVSYRLFSFREKRRFRKSRKKEVVETSTTSTPSLRSRPQVVASFGKGLGMAQFWSFYKTNTISIAKSAVFKILALFGVILLFTSLVQGYEYFGLQSYPVTYKVMGDIAGATSTFMIIIVVFFSGELVWRDRVVNISEVINATPHNALTSAFAKVISLVSIAVALHFLFIFMGVVSQLMRGYTAIELDVYLVDFFLDTLPSYIAMSALFVVIQTLVKNRYIGYFIGIVFIFAWSILLSAVHWSSTMLQFGNTPGIFYSDISGYGPAVVGTLWFDLYWILFSVVLILVAGFFWPRSVSASFKDKWKLARKNFQGTGKAAFIITLTAWILVAGFVYYNTQILNPYKNSKERELMAVEYEKTYKKYEDYPFPVLMEMDFYIDIFPEDRDVFIKAEGVYKNKGSQPIDSIFFNLDQRWDVKINIPNSTLVLNDSILGFQAYRLADPLLPGEFIDIEIESNYITKGFENSVGNTSMLENGTFFNNFSILPSMGYSEQVELSDKNDRKKYDLPPKLRMPELVDPCGELCMQNYLTNGRADWVDVETIISTSADQIAVAPGSLVKEWTENDRKYYQYKVDHPSQNFYSFMSARYDVARDKYKDVDIEIYHDPKHAVNVDMMIDAVRRSLAYYEENFGPYYHKQARILEFPRYSNFAQAFPGTMPYSESFGFITNLEDETDNNVIDAVIAHEMAHQWWAHQECPAKIQGGTMLSESFSEYSSLMVMKEESDDMKMKKFLKYDFDRYLRGRSSEREKELPLYKVENQQYIHYGKGAVLLYALQDYIGGDSVNAALKSFLEEFRYAEPPYPNSLDFLRHLEPRVPDSLDYLIEDWFKKITLYDFRLKEASLTELDNGKFEVEMKIEARKFYADTLGNETPATLKEWVDIGVYADSEEEELISWKRVKMENENDTYKLIVDKRPVKAVVDPRRMLIERVIKDNVKTISD